MNEQLLQLLSNAFDKLTNSILAEQKYLDSDNSTNPEYFNTPLNNYDNKIQYNDFG